MKKNLPPIPGEASRSRRKIQGGKNLQRRKKLENKKKKERIMKNEKEPTSDSRRSIQIQAKDPRRKEPTNKCIKK